MKRKKIFLSAAVLLFFAAGLLNAGESEGFHPFDQSRYPSPTFNVSKTRINHGLVIITLIQVKNNQTLAIHTNDENDFYCRVWVTIEKNGKKLDQDYLEDIEPVGGSFGFFIPKRQPSHRYFLIEKLGDYNGVLYLIDLDGNVQKINGGRYYLTDHGRYLFSEHDSDEDGVIDVFDLKEGKRIFTNTDPIPYDNLYRKGNLYFYTKMGLVANGNDEVEDKTKIIYFDFTKSKFIQKDVDDSFTKGATLVKYDFVVTEKDRNCECDKKP